MKTFEVNFDGLVGPTHNHAGLSFGNRASSNHGGQTSSPKQAALQGLEKMISLSRQGLKQAVLPPHDRPHVPSLRKLGFTGKTDVDIIAHAAKQAPNILASVSSSSAMWVANAATVSPFPDTLDGRTHFTPANLNSMFHRSIEVDTTSVILKSIFRGDEYQHHSALPAGQTYSDEGAANHSRLCSSYGEPGIELFVYGVCQTDTKSGPKKFPARQTRQASEAIARSHGLRAEKTVFAKQHPEAIDAGVFHNDVIAVANQNLLFCHQLAFAEPQLLRRELDSASGDDEITYIEVPADRVSLEDAVASYLFNSQLLSLPDQSSCNLIVPIECAENNAVKGYLDDLENDHAAISAVQYLDLRESMNNGGGPACLRLRVVMTQKQIEETKARVFLDEALYKDLKQWIERHYRESLHISDLLDPSLLLESRTALDELSQLLHLGAIYEFQQT
ncbi:MAG: N-succinylarginine dihydrolase [Proteobacteria bacterium]|jgi:succinylarginine dihydrolase|nr:N-succinylarginine dihydrolase [Pseudomonadota bacterium]